MQRITTQVRRTVITAIGAVGMAAAIALLATPAAANPAGARAGHGTHPGYQLIHYGGHYRANWRHFRAHQYRYGGHPRARHFRRYGGRPRHAWRQGRRGWRQNTRARYRYNGRDYDRGAATPDRTRRDGRRGGNRTR